MTTLETTFLGLIALSTAIMAAIQIGAIIFAARAAKATARAMQQLQGDLAPILVNARKASEDAAKMTGLALAQVEKIDGLVSRTVERVDDTVGALHEVVSGPLRKGAALWKALEALLAFLTSRKERAKATPPDGDESLFIG